MGAKVVFRGNSRSTPVWAGDFGGREHILPWPAKIDPTLFTDAAGIVVINQGIAAIGATVLNVSALTSPAVNSITIINNDSVVIKARSVLQFGAINSGKFAMVAVDSLVGDTTIQIQPLSVALADQDLATFSTYGIRYVPAGTLVGRTFVQRAANGLFHPADVTTPDDEIYLTMFDIIDAIDNNDTEFYRPGSLVKENYLPNYASMNAATLSRIRSIYKTTIGVN